MLFRPDLGVLAMAQEELQKCYPAEVWRTKLTTACAARRGAITNPTPPLTVAVPEPARTTVLAAGTRALTSSAAVGPRR